MAGKGYEEKMAKMWKELSDKPTKNHEKTRKEYIANEHATTRVQNEWADLRPLLCETDNNVTDSKGARRSQMLNEWADLRPLLCETEDNLPDGSNSGRGQRLNEWADLRPLLCETDNDVGSNFMSDGLTATADSNSKEVRRSRRLAGKSPSN